MPQPHKYRHSNPVHRNEIISALTLLPGQKPAAHAGQEPPEEPKPADPTTSNRQSSWKPRRQTLQAYPHSKRGQKPKAPDQKSAVWGKPECRRKRNIPETGGAHIKTPGHFARPLLMAAAQAGETRSLTSTDMGMADPALKGKGMGMGTSADCDSSCLPPKALFTFGRRNRGDLFSPG